MPEGSVPATCWESSLGAGQHPGAPGCGEQGQGPGVFMDFLLFMGKFIQMAVRESSRLEKPSKTESSLWQIPILLPSQSTECCIQVFLGHLQGITLLFVKFQSKKIPQRQKWYEIREYKPCYWHKTAFKVGNNSMSELVGLVQSDLALGQFKMLILIKSFSAEQFSGCGKIFLILCIYKWDVFSTWRPEYIPSISCLSWVNHE